MFNNMWNRICVVTDPRVLFVSPGSTQPLVRKEGEDLLLPCLLTDPDATDFTLRMENGSAIPYGMNVTFDPRKGVLIQNVQPGFTADYICSARIGGIEKVSKIFKINIRQSEFYLSCCACSAKKKILFLSCFSVQISIDIYFYIKIHLFEKQNN